jgi:enamine deaminase RidA (YjgF/YER057c/UK114 family)
MAIEYLDVAGLVQTGRFRHAVRATGSSTVYLSGQVALDEAGEYVGVGDYDAQVRQVYGNLTRILESLGVGWEAVAMMHMYIVDFTVERYARLREIRAEFLGEIVPSATVIGVTALAFPEFQVEVELIVDIE